MYCWVDRGINAILFVTLFAPPDHVNVGAPFPLRARVLPEQTALLLAVAVRLGRPESTFTVTVLIAEVQFESMDPCTE